MLVNVHTTLYQNNFLALCAAADQSWDPWFHPYRLLPLLLLARVEERKWIAGEVMGRIGVIGRWIISEILTEWKLQIPRGTEGFEGNSEQVNELLFRVHSLLLVQVFLPPNFLEVCRDRHRAVVQHMQRWPPNRRSFPANCVVNMQVSRQLPLSSLSTQPFPNQNNTPMCSSSPHT